MATTLPQFQEDIDNRFVETWYEIRPDAVDNVLNATNVWSALLGNGSFTSQAGGDMITRTIRYAIPSATAVQKGDLLGQGETETETMAIWTFRNLAVHIQGSVFDDRENRGTFKIKDYIKKRTTEATDAMKQQYEANVLRDIQPDESGKEIQGLNDLIPPQASQTSGTYGKIARPSAYDNASSAGVISTPTASGTNPWWGPTYLEQTTPIVVNLLDDWKRLYNSISANLESPNLILCDQATFETYEEFAEDKTQIIKDETTRLADLGFSVLRFKGKTLMWSANVAANTAYFLNTNYIEVVYDPGMWFDMTRFKDIPLQGERIAHILTALNMIGTQPRRHGLWHPN
tara:strand:- start:51 stop:1085 length:1035 start_codon:yes stop_codon:yes gene_type:complete